MNSEYTLNNHNSGGAGSIPTPSSTSRTTSTPTIINGRYKVLRELNRGGTAVVYEGQDLHYSTECKSVALKIMSLKDGKATMPLANVKREVEYAASLQHENIVRLIDFVIDGQTIIIVWEIIVGPDLLDLLNECGGRMEEKDAAFYFSQLLQAVNFIHSNGLCHRDLKPENCMIDRATKKLKVIDFGLSKHQASAVTLGVGTPDYMSPELLGGGGAGAASALVERRTGHYDARAIDVWAMGVLLYLLVSGQYPFEDPAEPHNVVRTLQNIAAGRIRPLPRRTSPECASLLGAMLTKDPAQRITLASIAQHPWMNMWNVQKSEEEEEVFSFGRVGNKIAAAKTSTGGGGGGAETPRVFTIAASSTTTTTTTTNTISTPTPKTPAAVNPPPPTVMMMMNNNRDTVIPVTPPPSTRVDLMDVDSTKKLRLGSICKLLFGGH